MKKKYLAVFITIAALGLTQPAFSAIPNIDVGRVAALMKERFDELARYNDHMASEKELLEAEAEGRASGVDAFNAGSSGYTMRETQTQSDLFNMRMLLSSLPTQMACEQVSLKANLDKLLCSKDTILNSLNQHTASSTDHFDDIERSIANSYKDNESGIIRGVAAISGNALSKGTLSPEESADAAHAALLMAPRFTNRYHSDEPPVTNEEVRLYNQDLSSRAINSEITNAFNETIAMTATSNADEHGPSQLHAMRLEAQTFYSEDDFENTMAHRAALDSVSSPAQLYRNVALAKAKRIESSIMEYERSLKDYYLQAMKLNALAQGL